MRIFLKQNVLEAALDRIRWLFDQFDGRVAVNFSGGKDSTVIFHLAMQVARERGALPLKVVFLDQEAEWQGTVDLVTEVMSNPDVEPWWYQIPIKLENAVSSSEHFLICWDPAKEDLWMRPRWSGVVHQHLGVAYQPITQNRFGETMFLRMFDKLLDDVFPGDDPACFVTGVRCEESPSRTLGLTHYPTFKGRTWGKKEDAKRHRYTMHPIYDWSYTDVWKAIHEHGWPYNRIYDAQYSYGVPLLNMRVSNLHHETAVHALFYLQEVEPETYVKLCARLPGIDTAGKFGVDDYWSRELPSMFASWPEYRDYLLENLWDDEDRKAKMREHFERQDRIYGPEHGAKLHKVHVSAILTNDYSAIKLYNFERGAGFLTTKRLRGHQVWEDKDAH